MKASIIILFIFINLFVFGQVTIKYTPTAAVTLTQHTAAPTSSCSANRFRLKSVQAPTPSISGSCINMTPVSGSDNAAALWVCDAINLDSSFKMTTTVNFGSTPSMGDGIVFAIKQESQPDKIGLKGGNIGFYQPLTAGLPIGVGIGVEFDTFNTGYGDTGLPADTCNHAQMVRCSTPSWTYTKIGAQRCLKSDGTHVKDGIAHTICIIWDAANNVFKAFFDGREVVSAGNIRTYFTTPTAVYWGFTAGYGGVSAQNFHVLCNTAMVVSRSSLPAPTCAILAPVELTSFTTKGIDNKVNKLTWQTASERNNVYFTVERSRDGLEFETLSNIEGAGDSNSEKNYEIIDYNPFADKTYYKLSQTDIDGTVNFLGIKYIENENLEYTEVYGNPFEDKCKLKVKSSSNAAKQISVYDAMGKKIHEDNLNLDKGINDVNIDFSNYENGVYMILINHTNSTEYLKVIKAKI